MSEHGSIMDKDKKYRTDRKKNATTLTEKTIIFMISDLKFY